MSKQTQGLLILALIALLMVGGIGVLVRRAWQWLKPLDDDVSSPLLQRQLALGAIYTVLSPRNDRSLSGWTGRHYRADIRDMLDETWEVRGRRPKRAMREQMDAGLGLGHRGHPDLVARAERLAKKEGALDDARSQAAKALLAWDVARYADLARHGFSVGYLSRQQTLAYLQQADDLSRHRFDSWADFGAAFVLAKRVFDSQLTSREREQVSKIDDIQGAVRGLLDDPASAWRRLPWR